MNHSVIQIVKTEAESGDLVSCGVNMVYLRYCHSNSPPTIRFVCFMATPCQCDSGYTERNVNGTIKCELQARNYKTAVKFSITIKILPFYKRHYMNALPNNPNDCTTWWFVTALVISTALVLDYTWWLCLYQINWIKHFFFHHVTSYDKDVVFFCWIFIFYLFNISSWFA